MNKKEIDPFLEMMHIMKLLDNNPCVNEDTILINCSPEYSSITTQVVNHSVSDKSLHEVINLNLPSKGMSQVWDASSKEFKKFDDYLRDWIAFNIESGYNYLFISSVIDDHKLYSKIRMNVKRKTEEFKFLCVYSTEGEFKPDYVLEVLNESPKFWWQK